MPRLLFTLLAVLLIAGCEQEPSVPDVPPTPASATGTTFDPTRCGRIEGRVTWPGALPEPLGFVFGVAQGPGHFDIRMMPSPNQPRVDPATRGVAGAVVFLRGVNLAASKPWDLPPVRVEMRDRQIVVCQGDSGPRRVGFVRRGDAVPLASAEPLFHILRGRGVAYFSLTFPEPDRPLSRTLDYAGRVELTSGAGFYWANADLFVDDHPYYTLTGPDGRFALEQVPAGEVELVVWLPGWKVARQERDPESGLVIRQSYTPPVEATRKVPIAPQRTAPVEIIVP